MKFLDTNIILRYLTGDEVKQAHRCALLFERITHGHETVSTTPMVIAEVIWVLSTKYRHPKVKVVEGLRQLLNMDHLLVEDRETLLQAFHLFERYPVDFIDAYNGAVMQARGANAIYSYDRDFDVLPGIQRFEP